MKVAIVHDWLVAFGGAEKVLEQVFALFPDADIFSLIDYLPTKTKICFQSKQIKTTFIQKLPFAKKLYRYYLPLMPFAIEKLDLSDYDLVISSSSAVAKGVITGPSQIHICYCHSPARYLWDLQHLYVNKNNWLTHYLFHKMRIWDFVSSARVDSFIANSHFVAQRIQKCYRRESHVIYPPVDVEEFSLETLKENYYLTASRLVKYKKIDIIIKAFIQMPEKKLIVIGDGPEANALKKIARKAYNITFLGYQPLPMLKQMMQKAKGFVFAALEDFGIAPVEALACGTPVIAFGKGGALETIKGLKDPNPTGCFFEFQTSTSIMNAIKEFEIYSDQITSQACRIQATLFSKERFQKELIQFINKRLHR